MIIKIIKCLWVGAAIFVLYVTLDAFNSVRDSGVRDVLSWLMLILSFPAGLIVSFMLWGLDVMFSKIYKVSYFSLSLEWAVYFILGYLQWFKLSPYLFAKIRGRI